MKSWVAGVWVGALLVACGGAGSAPDSGAVATAAEGSQAGMAAVTPPGGLEAWLSDIEAGLPSMVDLSDNWVQAQKGLIELYVGRQEIIEQYWGPSGRLQGAGGEALADGVLELESAFHHLLQSVMEQPPDTVKVGLAVEAMREHLSEVRLLAGESGLILIPPVDSISGRG